MDSGTLTKVLHDFLTTVEGELSLSKGDYFLIEKVVDKHWYFGQSHNKVGKFPANHLHKVELPAINDDETIYISIAPFQGEQSGDLTFNKGEIIIGNAIASSDWLSGYIGSRKGIFPASYVWEVDVNLIKKSLQKKVEKVARVKTSIEAQLPDELSLTEGEIVVVTEILDDGWCRGYKKNGQIGIFPENFIVYQEDIPVDEVDRSSLNFETTSNITSTLPVSDVIQKDWDKNYSNSIQSLYDDPAPSYSDLFPETQISEIQNVSENNSFGLKPYAISLFPFNAQFPNELSFEAEQFIELIKYVDNEWAEGMINNTKGIFPVSYVNIIVDCVKSQSDKLQDEVPKIQNILKSNDRVKVEYTFNAQMDGDLTVSEGEIVTVIETTNNDWVTVQNEKGEVGLCPSSYLAIQPTVDNEISNNSLDDFVVIKRENKDLLEKNDQETKRLSEPHRPAPPVPIPGRVPLQKQNNQIESDKVVNTEIHSIKQKKADQRQNVITELYLTEKDYIRDLKMTCETFDLRNPSFLESKGIDVPVLFGNILEIIEVAEELLELIQRAMKGCDEDYQIIGTCFLKMSEKMRKAYGRYCSNHEFSLALLQKYEDNKEIMKIFEKGIETLRIQVICFDMNSVLIKPVQRILKYPLILNELLKSTDDNHPDKEKIEEASKVMADVASYINEYKRKKELASKYLHSNNTLIGRMANLNMHSVAKKSSRLSAKLSATLGLTNLRADTKFDELAKDFFSLEKHTKQFLKDVENCLYFLDDETYCGDVLIEQLHQYFTGVPNHEVWRLREIRNLIRTQFIKDFKTCIESRVIIPINNLILLLEGPELLINKRHDKMLDYDSAILRNEKYKEKGIVAEDLTSAKNNFEALNQQLLEELPILIEASTAILYNCIGAFTNARKLYNGRIMKKYLAVSETVNQVSMEDILESFLVYHNLLYNQISRLSYDDTNAKIEKFSTDCCLQCEIHKKAVKEKYPPNKVYVVTRSVSGATVHDLPAAKGTIVGIIKTQDPMGNTSRWFVDNGSLQGFIESQYLEPSEEAKLIEESANIASKNNSVDLMSLDSPVKENKRYSADLQSIHYANSMQDYSSNYDCIKDVEPMTSQIYENIREEFVYVLFDFHEPSISGTLSVKQGQALKVLMKHDDKNNSEWWLVENRTGGKGYVPCNYLKIA